MRKFSALIAAAGLSIAASAHATIPMELLGSPAGPSMATRTVSIEPATAYVNVNWGEVVAFKAGGREFAFKFDGVPEATRIDLQRLAPAGALDRPLYVYVDNFSDQR
jgi:hypothetical protein